MSRGDKTGGAYIKTLDGWRALAIAAVLVDHGADSLLQLFGVDTSGFSEGQLIHLKQGIGDLGVHTFFVLSGYLITMRLVQEQAKNGTVSFPAFFLRRFFRIQPAALTYLAFAAALAFAGFIPISGRHLVAAAVGYANYDWNVRTWYTGHFWSLSIEQQFYVFWPLAFVALARMRLSGSIAIIGACLLWRLACLRYELVDGMNFWQRTDIELEWLVSGCAAALAVTNERSASFMRKLATSKAWLLALPLIVAPALELHWNWKLQQVCVTVSILAVTLLVVSTVAQPDAWFSRLLESKPFSWVGRISYSLYLWQQLFLVWPHYEAPRMGMLQNAPLNFACAVLAATLSFYFVETPMTERGRLVIRRLVKPRAATATTPAAPAVGS